jgi:hypothetical protein
LVDPFDVDDMAEGLYQLVFDEDVRRTQIGRGYERARRFCWSETARQTLRAYEEVEKQETHG